MYKVMYDSVVEEFATLDLAIKHAKTLDVFVTIQGGGYDMVGKFGVDSVEDSRLPDGTDYTWKMRRDESHRSWRKIKM
jgi:hypothetical protein